MRSWRTWRMWSRRSLTVGAVSLAIGAMVAACGQPVGSSTVGNGPPMSNLPCDTSTQWSPPSDNVQLNALALTGPGTGWAIGNVSYLPWQSGSTGPVGVIYHLVKGQWQRLAQTYPGEELTSIAMTSPSDGWIAASGTAMFLLHYDGSHWTKVDVPAIDAAFGPPGGVSVAGFGLPKVQTFGTSAWYFAATDNPLYPNNPNSRATSVVILRDQNGAWASIPPPHVASTVTTFDFAAVSPDEAWLLTEDYGPSSLPVVLYHYANGTWTTWPTTYPGGSGQHLWMLSPTNGWTDVGDNVEAPVALLHYDGSAWAPVDLTPVSHAVSTVQYMTPIGEPTAGTTWFVASGTPADASHQALVAYHDGQWQRVDWPYSKQYPDVIQTDSNGTLWGIGNIMHEKGCAPAMVAIIQQGVFYSGSGGQWHETILP